jgi:hypothetical protein
MSNEEVTIIIIIIINYTGRKQQTKRFGREASEYN